ncbi:hypothetical protein EJ06DRAFT_317866 [Trichodelitschia bisporula]|uniref:Uncharacterized protein n=1 Tax=Trichodelitschia bisporula TaxID=703511 RepID=A0A6G1I4X7_9PEZI|nr:hypothetical protein EJ06DRAFT_317866 [Trichodelitschia bisporula]
MEARPPAIRLHQTAPSGPNCSNYQRCTPPLYSIPIQPCLNCCDCLTPLPTATATTIKPLASPSPNASKTIEKIKHRHLRTKSTEEQGWPGVRSLLRGRWPKRLVWPRAWPASLLCCPAVRGSSAHDKMFLGLRDSASEVREAFGDRDRRMRRNITMPHDSISPSSARSPSHCILLYFTVSLLVIVFSHQHSAPPLFPSVCRLKLRPPLRRRYSAPPIRLNRFAPPPSRWFRCLTCNRRPARQPQSRQAPRTRHTPTEKPNPAHSRAAGIAYQGIGTSVNAVPISSASSTSPYPANQIGVTTLPRFTHPLAVVVQSSL